MRFSSTVDARQVRHVVGAGGDDDVLGLETVWFAAMAP